MKQTIRLRFLSIILFLALSLAVGIGIWPAQIFASAPTYKIGILQPFTGPYALYGKAVHDACKIAADEMNIAGGIKGRRIELLTRDTKAKVDVGVREAQDLILRGGVDAIIGVTSSGVNLGVIEVTKEYKVIHISTIANTEKASLERIHPYYFQTVPNSYIDTTSTARFAMKMPIKNFITIAADYEWGHSSVEIFTGHMSKERPEVQWTKKFWPKLGEVDYTSYVTAILAEKPDICFAWFAGADFMNFVKQAKGYGFFEKVRFVGPAFEDDLMDLGAEFPEGMLIYSRGAFYGIDTPQMKTFQQKYLTATGRYPSCWAILSYDAFTCLMESIKRAGSFDKDAIAKNLEGGKFKTLRGELNFRPIDHMMNSPMYFSTSFFDKAKGFCIGKDVTVVPGENCMRSPEEIKKIRAEKGIVFKPWHEK